jgi:predicted nucleic acid-binding protein
MVVFDASTLILLTKIDMLDIFIDHVKKRCLIPETVKNEVCIKGMDEMPLIVKMIDEKKMHVVKAKDRKLIKKLMDDFHIDAGEAEAIAIALNNKAELVATDDRNAIRACKMLKIDFTSAIAILIRAVEKNLIARDEALIKLKTLGSLARYKSTILNDALKRIKGGK